MAREQINERVTRPTAGTNKTTGTSQKRGRTGPQRAQVQTLPGPEPERERERRAAVERAEPMPDTGESMQGTAEPMQGSGQMPDTTGHLAGELTVRWVHVPVPIGVRVHAPHLPMPSPRATAQQAVRVVEAVRSNLPPPERLAYYGGLGVLAVVGALEWPVAAAIGAGFWLTGRRGQQRTAAQREARWREEASKEPPEEPRTPATT